MPFTEEELRAVLEDNSAEVPPVSDLTGNAERRGRRIRRRRYAAGAAAAACAVGVGALVLPGLADGDGGGGQARPVAASVSPSPRPVHVDASVLTGAAEQRVISERLQRLAWAAAAKRPLGPMFSNLGFLSTPSAMAAFADVVVTGTVEGFEAGRLSPAVPGTRTATRVAAITSVVMRVRVDGTVKGKAPGDRVYIRVGSGPGTDPREFQAAIPPGARLVAFLQPVPSPLGDGGGGTGHPAGTTLMDQQQGLVFEDAGAGGTKLVGGPYLQGAHLGEPWSGATTVDRLATLLRTVRDDCTAMGDRLAELKAKLRDQQVAGGRVSISRRILVGPHAVCGKPALVRPLSPAPTASPAP